jgi:DNA primase
MILDLAEQAGFRPTKTSSTKGGEYHCSCPSCGGDDRFMMWPEANRYWCRQCKASGDSIQFCRDFLNLSFQEALDRTGQPSTFSLRRRHLEDPIQPTRAPVRPWVEKAAGLVEAAHSRLVIDPFAMETLRARGLIEETVRLRRLGWNQTKSFPRRSEWGLDEQGGLKLCLPAGIVIPSFDLFGTPQKIKIRDQEWKEGDLYGKYREVPGSSSDAAIYGFRANQVVVLVESELDAILICQEAGAFCTCVALGGASKWPESATIEWLKTRHLILFALDWDDAGKEHFSRWRDAFPNLRAWPSYSEKSPADSYVLGGIDLKQWFTDGIERWNGSGTGSLL